MNSQFKKGIIEICVLKIMEENDLSSFDVIEKLSDEVPVNENTIYPLLRRLTQQGYFDTYKVPSAVGAPKKYYKLTDEGKQKLDVNLVEWKTFIQGVSRILEGDGSNERKIS